MKLKLVIFLLFACQVFGATYYIANGGSNAAAGTEAAPWETLSTISSKGVVSGDSVLLNSGDTFPESLESTDVISGVTYSNYGTGDLPIITLRDSVPLWDVAISWTEDGANHWKFVFPFRFVRCFVTRSGTTTEYMAAETGADLTSTYNFVADETGVQAGWLLWIYNTSNPSDDATIEDIQVSAPTGYIYTVQINNTLENVTFDGLDIQGGQAGMLINSTTGAGITVKNCNIGKYSGTGIAILTGAGGTIKDSTIASGWPAANATYTSEYANSTNDGIIITSTTSNWDIHGNTITNWGHDGINIGSSSGETISDINVYDNDISAANCSYGRGFETAEAASSTCSNIRFSRNIIHDTSTLVQFAGSGNYIENNIFHTFPKSSAGHGWNTPAGEISQAIGCGPGNANGVANYIINNTFDDIAGPAIGFYATATTMSGFVVTNNIANNCGNDSYGAAQPYSLYVQDDAGDDINNNTFNNNIWYQSGAGDVILYQDVGMTVAEFEAAVISVGFGDVATENQNADPVFVDESGDDFHLSSSSPAIDAGTDVGLRSDYDGVPIMGFTVGTSYYGGPDIGAYEFVTFKKRKGKLDGF